MRTIVLDSLPPFVIFIIILVVAGVVALAAFGIYRLLHPKLKEEPRDTTHDVEEELDRVLQPIEDEKVAKEVSQYKEEEDE